jgi:hypothetical protein
MSLNKQFCLFLKPSKHQPSSNIKQGNQVNENHEFEDLKPTVLTEISRLKTGKSL